MRVPVFLLWMVGLCWGQGIEARLAGLLSKYPAVAKGSWGAYAVDLGTGEVVFARDAEHTFVPASNNKLFASAYALTKLGPEYRFVTRVVTRKPLDGQGVVTGDVVLVGGGDPSLSGREWPYKRNGTWRDAYAPLEELAGQVWERGVRRIRGNVVGNDRAYVHEPFPPGWGMDDTLYDYGAPVSALVVHDNYVTARLEAGQPGEVAYARVTPEAGYFQIVNRTVSVSSGRSNVTERRSGDGRVIELEGTVAAGAPVAMGIALDDPARYAAHVFRRLLQARGIVVEGEARAAHRYEGEATAPEAEGVELARRSSPPMTEVVQMTNKLSQNLYAELLLREVARVEEKGGARRAAIAGLGGWLRGLGASGDEFVFFDGSGLTRLALVSPQTVMRVLKAMVAGPNRDAWLNSLPVGGEDGTLSQRFKGWNGGVVRAKTGTLSHVTGLSGYVEGAGGRMLGFSVLANNANTSAAGIRGFVDGLVQAVFEESGARGARGSGLQ